MRQTDREVCAVICRHDGIKAKDIARELNLPLGTVKTRINRARKMLEKQLERPDNGKAD